MTNLALCVSIPADGVAEGRLPVDTSNEQVFSEVKHATREGNIVCGPLPETPDGLQEPGSIDKLWREVHLPMKWLKAIVPNTHYLFDEPEVLHLIVITDKIRCLAKLW